MIDPKLVGKTYPPTKYVVGIEKIKEYTRAVGETNPLCVDEKAAAAGPYGEIVAPPTFAVVYTKDMAAQFLFDKELDLNMMMLVHGEQEFIFHKAVKHNDTIITTGKLASAEARKQNLVVTFEAESRVGDELVTISRFTFLVRGGAA
ncbi:MAG: MaoC family dehydratase N-terminal domain-containing protein [Candidatus Lernaella stagnicola]|nr:MaoC family dehydratase N-terminal domain-containing protein [Candidatus Lernaella stagnicola]